MKQFITKSKTVILLAAVLGSTAQVQSALFTTANDFAQFNSGAGVTSTAYYSVNSIVNGIGNNGNPGGTGTAGSLQLTSIGGWNQYSSGSDFPINQASLSAIDPGALAQYSAGSGGGPGTLVAHSGTMSFDFYGGNFNDWNHIGITLNENGHYDTYFPATTSTFTGADGRTWTQCVIDYNISDVSGGLTYFGVGIAQNDAGDTEGDTFFVDNFQVTPVPEPAATRAMAAGALVACSAASEFFRRRRAD